MVGPCPARRSTALDGLAGALRDLASGVAIPVRNPVRWLEEVLGLWTVEP